MKIRVLLVVLVTVFLWGVLPLLSPVVVVTNPVIQEDAQVFVAKVVSAVMFMIVLPVLIKE